jgi:hypothetical protein
MPGRIAPQKKTNRLTWAKSLGKPVFFMRASVFQAVRFELIPFELLL